MPTLVSPATSIRSATGLLGPSCANVAQVPIILSFRGWKSTGKKRAFLRRCAQDDRELAELVGPEDQELHALADGVLADEIGEAFRGLDGLAVDGGDEVGGGAIGVGLEAPLL